MVRCLIFTIRFTCKCNFKCICGNIKIRFAFNLINLCFSICYIPDIHIQEVLCVSIFMVMYKTRRNSGDEKYFLYIQNVIKVKRNQDKILCLCCALEKTCVTLLRNSLYTHTSSILFSVFSRLSI